MKTKYIIPIFLLIILIASSCEEDKIVNNPPEKPTAINGEIHTCKFLRPTLIWDCSDADNDELTYKIMFGTSPTELSLIAENLSAKSFTFGGDLLLSTMYYWQIIASDGKDETIGDIWQFSTVSDPIESKIPSTPILISPDYIASEGLVIFLWRNSKDDGDVSYTLTIDDVDVIENISDTTCIYPISDDFKWYVTVSDNDGNSSESEHLQIKVE